MEYKKEHIESYLADIKQAVVEKRYTVSSREKNEQLFLNFPLTS